MSVSTQSANPSLVYVDARIPERAKGWFLAALLAVMGLALLVGMARPANAEHLATTAEAPLLLD